MANGNDFKFWNSISVLQNKRSERQKHKYVSHKIFFADFIFLLEVFHWNIEAFSKELNISAMSKVYVENLVLTLNAAIFFYLSLSKRWESPATRLGNKSS